MCRAGKRCRSEQSLVLDTEQTVFVGQDLAAAMGISVSGLSNTWADDLPMVDELAMHAIDQPTPIWSPSDQVAEGDLAVIMKHIEPALQRRTPGRADDFQPFLCVPVWSILLLNWLNTILLYNYQLEYIPGSYLVLPDMLSRIHEPFFRRGKEVRVPMSLLALNTPST